MSTKKQIACMPIPKMIQVLSSVGVCLSFLPSLTIPFGLYFVRKRFLLLQIP